MIQVNEEAFARAIQQTYKGYDDQGALGYARLWAQRLRPELEQAVTCWIQGERVPNVSYQPEGGKEYSIESIMLLRGKEDVMEAMLLLSDYMNDPRVGELRIMTPVRTRL